MKKLLFVFPLLAAFVMMGMPVASANDAVELAIQAALGTDPAGVNTVAGIARTTLDELRSAVANELHDPYYAATGHTVGSLTRQVLDEMRYNLGDPLSDPGAPQDPMPRTVGWLARQTYNTVFDTGNAVSSLHQKVDGLQVDVDQLQASVDEVIDLLKTPQGRRDGWNE